VKAKFLILVSLAVARLPAVVRAEETQPWHTAASLHLFLAGLSGNVTVKVLPANVTQRFTGPLGLVRSGRQDGWDPIAGLQFTRPFRADGLTFRC